MKWSKSIGKSFLLALVLFSLSLPGYSLTKNPDGSVTLSAEEYQEVTTLVQSLTTDLDALKKINEQQGKDLTISATQIAELKQDNERQKKLLETQGSDLIDFQTSLGLTKTSEVIGWTIGGVSITVNLFQAVAYYFKK